MGNYTLGEPPDRRVMQVRDYLGITYVDGTSWEGAHIVAVNNKKCQPFLSV